MEETKVIQDAVAELKNADENELKSTIEKWFESIRTQGMKIGASYISAAVFSIIQKHTRKIGKISLRDYERMTAEIIKIVSVQLKTQQNDSEVSEETNDDGTAE